MTDGMPKLCGCWESIGFWFLVMAGRLVQNGVKVSCAGD